MTALAIALRDEQYEVAALRQRIGIVLQDFRLLDHMTTYENVALPSTVRKVIALDPAPAGVQCITNLLDSTGSIYVHDEPLSPKRIVEKGLLSQKLLDQVSEYALALFARGQEIAKKRGLILVDTKYEFGVDRNGVLTIADEGAGMSEEDLASLVETDIGELVDPADAYKKHLHITNTRRALADVMAR